MGLAREDLLWRKGPMPVMHPEEALYLNAIYKARQAIDEAAFLRSKRALFMNQWASHWCAAMDPLLMYPLFDFRPRVTPLTAEAERPHNSASGAARNPVTRRRLGRHRISENRLNNHQCCTCPGP
jgi:hypothetical protein